VRLIALLGQTGEKGFHMITQTLKRAFAPEGLTLPVAQAVVMFCAVLIPGYGFYKMASLGLTEAQWLLGLAIVVALVLQCLILYALIDLKRKAT
jgi:hypothetical protein